MTEGELKLETPKGWAVRPIDGGTHTALVFQQHEGDPIGVALNNNDLSRFVCKIISEAAKLASKQEPSDPPKKLAVDPIPVVSMGVGREFPEDQPTFYFGNHEPNVPKGMQLIPIAQQPKGHQN